MTTDQSADVSSGGRLRPVVWIVALLACVGLAGGIVRVVQVHQAYGVWAVQPGARTPKLPFHGRSYHRSEAVTGDPSSVDLGPAPGGGHVFGAPMTDVPTTVVVRYGDGSTAGYTLSGGS